MAVTSTITHLDRRNSAQLKGFPSAHAASARDIHSRKAYGVSLLLYRHQFGRLRPAREQSSTVAASWCVEGHSKEVELLRPRRTHTHTHTGLFLLTSVHVYLLLCDHISIEWFDATLPCYERVCFDKCIITALLVRPLQERARKLTFNLATSTTPSVPTLTLTLTLTLTTHFTENTNYGKFLTFETFGSHVLRSYPLHCIALQNSESSM